MASLNGRSVISINDLNNDEINALFELTDHMESNRVEFLRSAPGKVAATLFYEPSTRTRLSFESAMLQLGGGVISSWDMSASSVAKGESLPDTVRVVGSYAHIIILRHLWEGAARLAAEYSSVPVINAGDGGHEHPTQTLCDLYTLRKHYGKLQGLTVALCGDLQNGRTVHSLAFALVRFGAGVLFLPGDGKDIPHHVLHRMEREFGAKVKRIGIGVLAALFGREPSQGPQTPVNAIYMTPTQPNQLALFPQEGTSLQFNVSPGGTLSLYVTRRQVEREQGATKEGTAYPRVTPETLRQQPFKNISILHPLPRVDEVSPEVDMDPRSLYFKQAAYGVPIRMALLYSVLGLNHPEEPFKPVECSQRVKGPLYADANFKCSNTLCVTNRQSSLAHKRFEIVRNENYALRCLYCDYETPAPIAGNAESRRYYASNLLDKFQPYVKLGHVRFFGSEEEASALSFSPMVLAHQAAARTASRKASSSRTWIEAIQSG